MKYFSLYCANQSNTPTSQTELDSTDSMLSTHTPTFTPEAFRDHGLIRQKRLQKFLMVCAKGGVMTPLPLNVSQQDNATFDTMLEVECECQAIGIATPDRPFATASKVPLPPTPETAAKDCVWCFITNEESWTPNIPENDGCSPNFPEVLGSFLTNPEYRKDDDGYGKDYDPRKDKYCVADDYTDDEYTDDPFDERE